MAVAAAEQLQTPIVINQELQRVNDEATWLAEAIYGSMRSEFDFTFNGEDLVAEDGRELRPIFDAAITEAISLVKTSPNLLFELRRRIVEHDEYEEMIEMARGNGPNTMIVVSDYPQELMAYQDDIGGYNASRKQTMVRVITRDNGGVLKIKSQSLDHSDRQALEKIYETFGIVAQEGELLGQRIYLDLPESWQATVIDTVRDAYDSDLTMRKGGKRFAGIEIGEQHRTESTYDFVKKQQDILNWLTENMQANPEKASQFRYNAAALIEERYRASTTQAIVNGKHVSIAIDVLARAAGASAEREGRTFSGCGMSLMSNENTIGELQDSGYGNKTESSESYSFNKSMHCVVCQSPPKKGDGKKLCGPCGICRSCDKKLGGKG